MKYWDTSALLPLLVEEPTSAKLRALLKKNAAIVTWWATPVELYSAINRRHRQMPFVDHHLAELRQRFTLLISAFDIITPTQAVRDRAIRIVALHPLRAADALQLAAALQWSQTRAEQKSFVCLDERLRSAAFNEGFSIQP